MASTSTPKFSINELAEIRTLVRDEINTNAARAVIEAMSRPNPVLAVLKHPLVLTGAGFLLSFVVGSFIENQFSGAAEERQATREAILAAQQHEVAARDAVIEFVTVAQERLTATDLLRSAISRNAQASLLKRKASYDTAYVNWNNSLQANQITLRQAIVAESRQDWNTPSIYEPLIRDSLVPQLSSVDGCITTAFDQRLIATKAGVEPQFDGCGNLGWESHINITTIKIKRCLDAINKGALFDIRVATENSIARAQGLTAVVAVRQKDNTLTQFCRESQKTVSGGKGL